MKERESRIIQPLLLYHHHHQPFSHPVAVPPKWEAQSCCININNAHPENEVVEEHFSR